MRLSTLNAEGGGIKVCVYMCMWVRLTKGLGVLLGHLQTIVLLK